MRTKPQKLNLWSLQKSEGQRKEAQPHKVAVTNKTKRPVLLAPPPLYRRSIAVQPHLLLEPSQPDRSSRVGLIGRKEGEHVTLLAEDQ